MNKTFLAVTGLAVVVLGVLLFDMVFTVHEREQALVLQFGETKAVVPEAGIHFKLPFVQNVVYFDERILDFDAKTYYVDNANGKVVVRPPAGYEHHRGDWVWGSFVSILSRQIGSTGMWTLSIAEAKSFDMRRVRERFPKCQGRFFYLGDGDDIVKTLRAWGN